MKIRKATLKDFEKLKKIRAEFFLLEASTDERLNRGFVKRGLPISLGKSLRCKDEIHFVAEEKGEFIGYSAVEITNNNGWVRYKKQGHLYNLYVLPKYQGKRIGTLLLKKSLEWFKEKNIKDLKILAYTWNTRAQKLYRKHGYTDYMLMMKK